MRFQGKVALISGGGAGMGRAAALGFAKEGASVVINDVSEENLKSAAEEIREESGVVTAVQGDSTSSTDIKSIVDKALEQYGKIDILFNYVGGHPDTDGPPQPFVSQPEDYWEKSLELNLWSAIRFSRAVLETMISRKYGKIINMSAVAGLVGVGRGGMLYGAAKGGIIAFTKSLARDVAQYNINVNCVCPGPIKTPAFERMGARMGISEEERAEAMAKSIEEVPLRRIGRPEEVASAVLYFASDDAGFITGQSLAIDGGMTMC